MLEHDGLGINSLPESCRQRPSASGRRAPLSTATYRLAAAGPLEPPMQPGIRRIDSLRAKATSGANDTYYEDESNRPARRQYLHRKVTMDRGSGL